MCEVALNPRTSCRSGSVLERTLDRLARVTATGRTADAACDVAAVSNCPCRTRFSKLLVSSTSDGAESRTSPVSSLSASDSEGDDTVDDAGGFSASSSPLAKRARRLGRDRSNLSELTASPSWRSLPPRIPSDFATSSGSSSSSSSSSAPPPPPLSLALAAARLLRALDAPVALAAGSKRAREEKFEESV
jgi:hypothetical protein